MGAHSRVLLRCSYDMSDLLIKRYACDDAVDPDGLLTGLCFSFRGNNLKRQVFHRQHFRLRSRNSSACRLRLMMQVGCLLARPAVMVVLFSCTSQHVGIHLHHGLTSYSCLLQYTVYCGTSAPRKCANFSVSTHPTVSIPTPARDFRGALRCC